MKKEIIKKLILTLTGCVVFAVLMQIRDGGWLLVGLKIMIAVFLFYLLISVSGKGEE